MIKRWLYSLSTTAFRRVLHALSVVVSIGCFLTIVLMFRAGCSFDAVLLAVTPFLVVNTALLTVAFFAR